MTTPTPGRVLRSRRAQSDQPRPVAVTQRSNAYGTRDSEEVEEQVTDRGDLTTAYSTRRGTGSRQRSASEGGTPSRKAPKRASSAPQPAIAEEEEEEQRRPQAASGQLSVPITSVVGTTLESPVGYEAILAAVAARRRPRREAPVVDDLGMVARPWDLTVFFISVLRFLEGILNNIRTVITSAPSLLVLLLLVSAVATFFSIPTLPPHLAERRERMWRGVRLLAGLPEWEQPPSGVEKDWVMFKHHRQFRPDELPDYNVPDLQWTININVVGRLEKLEEKTDKLAESIEGVKSMVQDIMPRLVVVDVVDKHLHITDDFYNAFYEKLHGDPAIWSAFLEKNQQAIDDMENARLDRFFDTASKSKDIVSSATAFEMIQDETERLLAIFAKNTAQQRSDFVKDVRDITEAAVLEVLDRNSGGLPPTGDLNKHYYIENTLMEMHNLNFFAPKHGAKTISKLTSPTAHKTQPNLLARFWAWAMYPPNAPVAALEPWSEYRDSWCATESTNKGKAQLGVKIKYAVSPSEFVVEHIPASGSGRIDTAPRDLELWMDAGTEVLAAHIQSLIEEESIRYKGMGGCTKAPEKGFVCIARGRYDIHSPNWVQKSTLR